MEVLFGDCIKLNKICNISHWSDKVRKIKNGSLLLQLKHSWCYYSDHWGSKDQINDTCEIWKYLENNGKLWYIILNGRGVVEKRLDWKTMSEAAIQLHFQEHLESRLHRLKAYPQKAKIYIFLYRLTELFQCSRR